MCAQYDGAKVRTRTFNDVFQAMLIMPSACTLAFQTCRNFVVFDGTHCSSRYGGILLIASTIDADENNLTLAWALVPSEAKEWWDWFFEGIATNLTTVWCHPDKYRKLTIISDRGKGLVPEVARHFPDCWHYFCTWHLAKNVEDRFKNNAITAKFKQMCRVVLEQDFHNLLADVRALNPEAAKYIEEIDPDFDHWATIFAPFEYPRYGHTTSGVGESLNSRFLEERRLPILHMMEGIWTYQMGVFYKRGELEQNDQFLTRFAATHVADRRDVGRRMICHPQRRGKGVVRLLNSAGAGWIVDIDARMCTCLEWQDLWLPYAHAWCAAEFFGIDFEILL